jgi:hypothetical protein
VISELEKIRQVFDDVGNFMERIEDFRDRLERRVRTTVHYMDVMGDSSAERLARVIEKLAALDGKEIELSLRSPDVGFPITALALYTPPAPRSPPQKTRFKVPKSDPYHKAYIAAGTAFDRMVRVSRTRLISFIDEKMAGREELYSSQIQIDSIEDLFAYRFLPGMAAFSGSADVGPYRVTLDGQQTENDWIVLRSFRIERLAPKRAA